MKIYTGLTKFMVSADRVLELCPMNHDSWFMVLRLFLLLTFGLSSCSTVQITNTNAFRYGHQFVTGDIPRVSRYLTEKITGLSGSDGSFWNADAGSLEFVSQSANAVYKFTSDSEVRFLRLVHHELRDHAFLASQ